MKEKCFFEINLVCGEGDPVAAEEFEHAQWAPTVGATGARSPSEKRGGRPQDVTSPTQDSSSTPGSSSTEWRKSSFKSQRSSSLG